MKEITHRDEVHGDVRFDPLAAALLDTPALQRLGRVYQLGYGHLVYRGGNHTRLSHVMGAYHAANKLVIALQKNYLKNGQKPAGAVDPGEFLPFPNKLDLSLEARWDVLRHLVCWAALLHDVAHVPLGHTLEDEFDGIYEKHDDFASPRISYLWLRSDEGLPSDIRTVFDQVNLYPESLRCSGASAESVWRAVMLTCLYKEKHRNLPERPRFDEVLLEESGRLRFAQELLVALNEVKGIVFFPYMADIVGNTICADYLDYLQRDPRNLGLDVLRDDRVVSRFWIGKDHHSQFRMALSLSDSRGKPRLDTCTGVVELVRQRFRFAEIVYYHKTKVAASAMLAKVFHLIGKPRECDSRRKLIVLGDVDGYVSELMSSKNEAARVRAAEMLRKRCEPGCLLDPEIGDESLHFFLFNRAWEGVQEAAKSRDAVLANRCLRAISLLQAIVRRRLHKVCFTIDRAIYGDLYGGGTQSQEHLERKLGEFINVLRSKGEERQRLEACMANASGWPSDAIILYVPPRKSQAKGIETWALSEGHVVTLGDHVAVKTQVGALNEQYKNLWRLLVLVAPEYRDDVVGLSESIDALIKDQFPDFRWNTGARVIESASWFPYIDKLDRAAAFRCRAEGLRDSEDWKLFRRTRETITTHVSEEEFAARGFLLWKLHSELDNQERVIQIVRKEFDSPGDLLARIQDELSSLGVEAYRGELGESVWATAISRIAKDLLGGLKQPSLFGS